MSTKVQPPISLENTSIAFSAKSNAELRKAYWLFYLINQPWMVKVGTTLVKWAFKLRLPIKWIVKKTVFAYFCGGENIEDCEPTIRELANYRIGTILDYSVEGEKTEKGFDRTAQETMRTIDKAAGQPEIFPFCVFKVTGVAPFNLLAKLQRKEELNEKEQKIWNNARKRVDLICQRAYERKVRILIDGEETWIQNTIDELAYEMMESYNLKAPIVYNTYQMYCKASLGNLRKAYQKAVMNQYFLGAKIVRGAYMEKERERAQEMGYEDPIQPTKEATDQAFDDALHFCIEKKQRVALCAGTHNEASSRFLTILMDKYNVLPHDTTVYFSQLYGMSDHISYNLASAGYNVAKYVPYGPVKAVLPYLFRRAEENTSVAGQSGREFSLIKQEFQRRRRAK